MPPSAERNRRVIVKLTDEELAVLDTVRIRAGFATPGEFLRFLWERELEQAYTHEAIREARG